MAEPGVYIQAYLEDGTPVTPPALPGGGVPIPRLMIARRAFPTAQRLLAGPVTADLGRIAVGWHDTAVSRETGSAAVVRVDGPYTDLIGDTLAVEAGGRRVYVYVVGRAAIPWELSLARRAFLSVETLAAESILATVGRVR